MDGDDDICPICMDVLELTDKSFNPCPCGFRLCVWCFHNINDKANGKCPACRSPYEVTAIVEHDIDPALVAAANEEHRERTHKEKVLVENTPSPVNDKTLQEMRIVQRNLVYVIGIPSSLAREESIKRNDLFIRYGKVTKVAVNKKTAHSNAPRPSFSAYITYRTREDALAAIRGLSGVIVEGRALKATYGTTKYCSFFLRGVACSNPSCLYLHKVADDEDCFTKEALANADRFSVHAYSRANSRAGALEREQSPGLTTTTPVVVNVKTTSVPSTITTPKKPSTRSNPKVTPRKTPVVTSKSRPAPRGVLKSTPSKEHSASKTPTVHPAPMPSPVAELNRESVPLHGHSDSPSTCSSQIEQSDRSYSIFSDSNSSASSLSRFVLGNNDQSTDVFNSRVNPWNSPFGPIACKDRKFERSPFSDKSPFSDSGAYTNPATNCSSKTEAKLLSFQSLSIGRDKHSPLKPLQRSGIRTADKFTQQAVPPPVDNYRYTHW